MSGEIKLSSRGELQARFRVHRLAGFAQKSVNFARTASQLLLKEICEIRRLSFHMKCCPDCGKELGAGVVKCWNPDCGTEFVVPVDAESPDPPIKKSNKLRQLEMEYQLTTRGLAARAPKTHATMIIGLLVFLVTALMLAANGKQSPVDSNFMQLGQFYFKPDVRRDWLSRSAFKSSCLITRANRAELRVALSHLS
jgi:hypothetical protein